MAMVCDCGHYLGNRSVCPKCGRSDGDPVAPSALTRMAWGDPLPSLDDPAFADDSHGDRVDAPPVPATWGELRGTVVEGEAVLVGSAGGLVFIRVLLLVVVLAGLVWKSKAIVLALTNGMISLLLTFLVPIILGLVLLSFVSKVLPVGSCLGQMFQMLTFSTLTRRSTESQVPNGWRITVENAHGATTAKLAAPLHLDGGEEVSLHGPSFRGVKHAWLIQVLAPRPTTRLARGFLPSLVTLIVGLPLLALLLFYL